MCAVLITIKMLISWRLRDNQPW